MRFLSVCSGIEAASVAWSGLGWECVGFAEIEPFPAAVLKHRFPEVRNFGDMRTITRKAYPDLSFELLVGGTPCQSFSVAGKREGLRGLSGLAMDFVRILEEFRPRWFIWENVCGCISTNGGLDFRTFLGAIARLGTYECAWRILDAQYFGVAQRRRRVFVVGCSGDGDAVEKVLLESESLPWNTGESGEKRKENPRETEGSSKATVCGIAAERERERERVARLVSRGHYVWDEIAATLRARDDASSCDLVLSPGMVNERQEGGR